MAAYSFFPFREARPWLSRKHNRASRGSKTVTPAKEKKTENAFCFSLSERHGRDSHKSTTVPLAEEKPWLSQKKKNRKRVFFRFRKARPWLSIKHNRASCGRKKHKHFFSICKRHGGASRENTIVPLAVEKNKNAFFVFERHGHASREKQTKIALFFHFREVVPLAKSSTMALAEEKTQTLFFHL